MSTDNSKVFKFKFHIKKFNSKNLAEIYKLKKKSQIKIVRLSISLIFVNLQPQKKSTTIKSSKVKFLLIHSLDF